MSKQSYGTWDIKYVKGEEIDSTFLGKEVRIDFKSNEDDSLSDKTIVRRLLAESSVVKILINNVDIEFREVWKLYPDHGVLNEQMLESVGSNDRGIIQIKGIYLNDINDNSLILKANVFFVNDGKFSYKMIDIDRKDIKGILVKL